MLYRTVLILLIAFTVVSCQFIETMVLNEDGSGRMSIEMDMGEMMAFGGMLEDTLEVRKDTIISMRDVLEEKKIVSRSFLKKSKQSLKKWKTII